MWALISTLLLFAASRCQIDAVYPDVCSAAYPGGPVCTCFSSSEYDCRQRALTKIPTEINKTVETLDLSFNQLTRIYNDSFIYYRRLTILYLQNNNIQIIDPGSFAGLNNLQSLYLAGNKLVSLGNETFNLMPSLAELDLSNNNISSIARYAFFTLPALNSLRMAGNRFLNCGCEEKLAIVSLTDSYFQPDITIHDMNCRNLNNAFLPVVHNTISCPQGEDLFIKPLKCYTCANVASYSECGNTGVASCGEYKPSCYSKAVYTAGRFSVTGGCMDHLLCMQKMEQNSANCLENEGGTTTCNYCHIGSYSNAKPVPNSVKAYVYKYELHFQEDISPEVLDFNSAQHSSFVRTVKSEVKNLLYASKGGFVVDAISFSDQSSMVLDIRISTMWFISRDEVQSAVVTSLSSIKTLVGLTVVGGNPFQPKDTCKVETQADPIRGTFTWPESSPGHGVQLECPYQLPSSTTPIYASRHCGFDGTWGDADISACPPEDENARKLEEIATGDINDDNVESVSSTLNTLSNQWKNYNSDQVTLSVDAIDKILATDTSQTSETVAQNTFGTIDNLLNVDASTLQESQNSGKTSTRLLTSVDSLLTGIDVSSKDFGAIGPNIAGFASKIDANDFAGFSLSYGDGTNNLTSVNIQSQKTEDLENGRFGIALPRDLFARAGGDASRITSNIYKDPKLFQTITNVTAAVDPDSNEVSDDDGDETFVRTINSNVVAASIPGVLIINLETPVKVRLPHLKKGRNVSCVYWVNTSSEWKTDGCTVNVTGDSYTECHCNHLTNFALLMDVYGTGEDISEGNKIALQIISYIGCALSFIGVVLTLLTMMKFRKLRRDNPSKILMNLCVAIGLVNIVFLVGVQDYTSSNEASCKLVAVLLHYCLLATMCWMAVEAFYMYLALVKIFDTYISRFQLKSTLFGWGLPLVAVIVTLAVNKTDNYGYQPSGICWLGRIPFYAAFLGPVCLIMILNLISFVLVLRQLLKRSSSKLTKTEISKTAVRLRGAFSLLVLLGLTWLFAMLAIGDFGIVFNYLFAISNSLQGFFIFIFYCVLKEDARKCWKQALPCFKSPYEASTTTQSQSNDSSFPSTSKTNSSTIALKSNDNSNTPSQKKQPKYEVDTSNVTAFRGRWQVEVPLSDKEKNKKSVENRNTSTYA